MRVQHVPSTHAVAFVFVFHRAFHAHNALLSLFTLCSCPADRARAAEHADLRRILSKKLHTKYGV